MAKNSIINVNGVDISIINVQDSDYICLTNLAKDQDGEDHIRNWMRNKNTVEYLGIWEKINNPNFKGVEFDTLLEQSGLNRFNLTPRKWIDLTNAMGIISKSGRNGGTYAHKDIAFNFGMWLSPEFYLLVVKEFQRLKDEENKSLKSTEWLHRRFLTKTNYKLQTDAIKTYILPELNISKEKEGFIYAKEADLLNVAVFGYTSKEWGEKNMDKVLKGMNIRDDASMAQLIALSNAEVINKELIKAKIPQDQRLIRLRELTIETLKSLENSPTINNIENNKKEGLSDFNNKLNQSLNYNPKKDKDDNN